MADHQFVGLGMCRATAQGAGDGVFVAGPVNVAQHDIGRGCRAADAGPAMHQQWRLAAPALGETQYVRHVIAGGRDAAFDGFRDVVDAKPKMVSQRNAGRCRRRGLRIEQRHDVRRAVSPDGGLDGGKGRDQYSGHGKQKSSVRPLLQGKRLRLAAALYVNQHHQLAAVMLFMRQHNFA